MVKFSSFSFVVGVSFQKLLPNLISHSLPWERVLKAGVLDMCSKPFMPQWGGGGSLPIAWSYARIRVFKESVFQPSFFLYLFIFTCFDSVIHPVCWSHSQNLWTSLRESAPCIASCILGVSVGGGKFRSLLGHHLGPTPLSFLICICIYLL